MSAIPGVMAFLRPFPVLEISTGATNQNQGQYAFSVSGVNPKQVYDAGDKLMAKCATFPGFLTVSSDYFNNTPNLDIEHPARAGEDPRRLRSAHSHAAAQRLLAKLSLPDQKTGRSISGDSGSRGLRRELSRKICPCCIFRSDDGKHLVPLNALVTWKSTLGPQAVNHLNQFTSVTLFFNLKPGVAIGDATDFINKAAGGNRAADAARRACKAKR